MENDPFGSSFSALNGEHLQFMLKYDINSGGMINKRQPQEPRDSKECYDQYYTNAG